MSIKVSFSRYCIGSGREQYNKKPCVCSRCLTERGETPDAYTELVSQINSAYNKFEFENSYTKIFIKGTDNQVKDTQLRLRDLIESLTEIKNNL